MKRRHLFTRALERLDTLTAHLDALGLGEDEEDRQTREEVEAHERRRDAELMAAAKALGEHNRGER